MLGVGGRESGRERLLAQPGGVATERLQWLGFGPADAGITRGSEREYVLFAYGVLGSVMIGWMSTLLSIARGPLRQRDAWAWTTMVVAITVWFVVDSTFSVVVGSVPHALFNVGFVVALAPPLIASAPRWPTWFLPEHADASRGP